MSGIYVLLLHGTWAGAGRWTHHNSDFRRRVRIELEKLGFEKVEFDTFPWNGKNRWRARSEVAKAIDERIEKLDGMINRPTEVHEEWEFLVIAHSHGGNIATEAIRNRMSADPAVPIRGIVCLNTPFLTLEVRGSIAYLLVWLVVSLALGSALWAGGVDGLVSLPPAIAKLGPSFLSSVTRSALLQTIVLIGIFLATLLLISRRVKRAQREEPTGPTPNVLCLSCPDDEAITFLGLGEGIANLPQLFLHPIALILAATTTAFLLYIGGDLGWCGTRWPCWDAQLASVTLHFVLWVGTALLGGLIGNGCVAALFGLSFRHAFAALVSRVLVSYIPLRPARSTFRGISELGIRWGNPLQLFHSAIFKSPETFEEISAWLKRDPTA